MKLSPQEKAANREAFRAMNLAQKAEYIFAYYKLPLVLIGIVLVAGGWMLQRAFTHKDPLLYLAYVNVVPSSAADASLTAGFVEATGASARRTEVVCYRELYLTSDATTAEHQYAYASRLKTLAAVDAEQLDVVLMNREAYDLLSASGYLLDLTQLDLPDATRDHLTSNTVVLEDNRIEVDLGEADRYEASTLEAINALEVTDAPSLCGFSIDEPLYLGVIGNTPRLDTATAYLTYVSMNA